MVRMKWTNPWRAFHAEHIVNTQQNKQKHTTSHTLNMWCCKSPSAHWWNSEIETHTKQQLLFYSVSLTLQGSQPLLLHPVSNERQGEVEETCGCIPWRRSKSKSWSLSSTLQAWKKPLVLRRGSHMIQKVTLAWVWIYRGKRVKRAIPKGWCKNQSKTGSSDEDGREEILKTWLSEAGRRPGHQGSGRGRNQSLGCSLFPAHCC